MTLSELFTNIANAIRGKEGSTGSIPASDFATRISAIETGVDTSDATVTADKMLDGYTGYANGVKVTGNIPSKSASDLSASGATVTVPAGHYASQATKSVDTVTQATPSVSVSSSGLITASATQSAGYVAAGTKSGTKQLTTQAAKTVTPSSSSQTAVASGRYTTGAVTVSAVPTQTKSATPSASSQTVSPDSGKFLSSVTVSGDANLKAANIKSGVSIFGVAGSYVGGANFKTADVMASSKNAMVLSPGFQPKYAMGIFMDDADTDVGGSGILSFFVQSNSSTSMTIYDGVFNYDELGYAYCNLKNDAAATISWTSNSVSITPTNNRWYGGYYKVYIFG